MTIKSSIRVLNELLGIQTSMKCFLNPYIRALLQK